MSEAAHRLIAHLDMDAFYASVELLRYPELRGMPLVIGGASNHQPTRRPDGTLGFARLREYAGRGVVTTATYEARALGVHSGMGVMKAARLAPDAVLLPVDFDEYRRYSRAFKAAVQRQAPHIEDRGIDEIYIDLSDVAGAQADHGRAAGLALKDAVRQATGLGCSIGISPNKLLSKLCSDLDKPDGLTLLRAEEIPSRIWPLPASRINGIGPKANARLAAFGITCIGELARADRDRLVAEFGRSFGSWLHDAAHGRDDRPLVMDGEPKSISRETTFERDLHAVRDRAVLGTIFTELCDRLAADLTRKGYAARNVAIKLRYDDFRSVTRAQSLPQPTADAALIRRAAGECLKRVDLHRRLRLLGVRAGTLSRPATDSGPAIQAAARGDAARTATLPLFDDCNALG